MTSSPIAPTPPQIIKNQAQMNALLNQLEHHTTIAVDTEFIRETTYYPKLALVQIATDSLVACVDPLAFDAKAGLRQIFSNSKILKVFHACSQDLEVLFYYLGEIPQPIYDTQLAYALLTPHHQVSYAQLVEDELNVVLDKSQSRSNWLQRPLTPQQIKYAGDDVFYLFLLFPQLVKKLDQLKRSDWLQPLIAPLIEKNDFNLTPDVLLRRVKGISPLNKRQIAIVQVVALWRESLAQLKDKPRRRILSDDSVVYIAQNLKRDFTQIKTLAPRGIHFSDDDIWQLLDIIEQTEHLDEASLPDNNYQILTGEQKTLVKQLQKAVCDTADNLGLSSAILCTRKSLKDMVLDNKPLDDSKHLVLQSWRLDCVGKTLLTLLKQAL